MHALKRGANGPEFPHDVSEMAVAVEYRKGGGDGGDGGDGGGDGGNGGRGGSGGGSGGGDGGGGAGGGAAHVPPTDWK